MLPFHFVNVKESSLLLKNNYIEFGSFHDLNIFFERYFNTIDQLIFLSKYFGQSILNIQGPGGNISIKLDEIIFIKSSGAVLGNLSYSDGYCFADNNKCLELLKLGKELELKDSKIFGYKIPSMETFFHSFMKKYTVHIHFTLSNIIFCSNKEEDFTLNNFPYKYEIIRYIPPGLLLAQEVYKKYSKETDIYFLENHGIIITSDNLLSIIDMYENIYEYFNHLLDNKFEKELNTFYINKEYYFRKGKSLIIRHIDYPYLILQKIKYCFPDLAIFIEKIGIFNNLEELYENMDHFNIIILNNSVYLCAENINKIYYLIELIDKYKILSEYSYNSLNRIDDIKYLQNMEQEKFRKI
jgi:ribulose-5-phosphate 4-epimerase/fuculose-1-phosphate aldolase